MAGKRNLANYAESGKRKVLNTKYNLHFDEMEELGEICSKSFWKALSMAFFAGVEAGYRIGSKEKGGNAK